MSSPTYNFGNATGQNGKVDVSGGQYNYAGGATYHQTYGQQNHQTTANGGGNAVGVMGGKGNTVSSKNTWKS
jgi:hypothetical protein